MITLTQLHANFYASSSLNLKTFPPLIIIVQILWWCVIARCRVTYQFNQAVVGIEVSVYDAHWVEVRLKQRGETRMVKIHTCAGQFTFAYEILSA